MKKVFLIGTLILVAMLSVAILVISLPKDNVAKAETDNRGLEDYCNGIKVYLGTYPDYWDCTWGQAPRCTGMCRGESCASAMLVFELWYDPDGGQMWDCYCTCPTPYVGPGGYYW